MFLHKKMVARVLSVLLPVALHFPPSCFGQAAHPIKSNSGGRSRLNDSIALVLYNVGIDDQKYRMQMEEVRGKYGGSSKEMNALLQKMQEMDSVDLVKIRAIIDRYGWLGADSIGYDANNTLFMVIQHSDLKVQQIYLPKMREAVKNGRARARDLALLEDRVALRTARQQIYGSQVSWNMKTNEYAVAPLEDPVNVDKRRASVGLGPLADYLMDCCHLIWNPYGLITVSSIIEYQQQVMSDPNQELVALAGFVPGVILDIRYATSDNLMHHPVYALPVAFLRRPAAESLRAVAEELRPLGYGLKVFDGYRPYKVTVQFYEAYHDSNFVASPYTGSRHNRGCAVDLTLVDLATGKEPEMPTGYDAFTKEAAADYAGASSAAMQNRKVLQDAMLRHGFLLYPGEWWHFDFAGWKNYPVTDIPFEELTGTR